ncbi:MAG: hypothetical protein QOJ14_2167 [Thermoleophilaceae bacterium]|nr:hypothetical protein [Thermoleophilaceae bacterium]
MPWGGPDPRDQTVASDTSTRVGDVLERAEARAREIREQADRSAAEVRRTARHEAEGIAKEARRAAAAAARERVHRISELRASIAARAGSLVEGLEGGELTAARLQELVRALGQAADRVTEVVGDDASARPTGEAAAQAPASAAASIEEAAPPGLFARTEGDAHEPQADEPIADPLPDGAPIVRRPARASSARYTAVVMAIQGSDREAVAERLARDHGLEDADELLDDVFGRADARA